MQRRPGPFLSVFPSILIVAGCTSGEAKPPPTGALTPTTAPATTAASSASSSPALASSVPPPSAPSAPSVPSVPSAPSAPSSSAPVGSAKLLPDGTIELTMFSPHALLRYPPTHPDYANVRDHVGPLSPGQEKAVAPFPATWPRR